MSLPSCTPLYEYRPTSFVASETKCVAPVYAEHRSRLFAGGTFFRSIEQGPTQNLISVECLDLPESKFNVYYNGTLVHSYNVTFGAGSIAGLRAQVHNLVTPDTLIEMLEVAIDYYDERMEEIDDGITGGLTPFILTPLSGGEGGPTTDTGLSTIRTGPERSLFILSTTELYDGSPSQPPNTKRVQQWNGIEWISYCNFVQGQCPLEGTC